MASRLCLVTHGTGQENCPYVTGLVKLGGHLDGFDVAQITFTEAHAFVDTAATTEENDGHSSSVAVWVCVVAPSSSAEEHKEALDVALSARNLDEKRTYVILFSERLCQYADTRLQCFRNFKVNMVTSSFSAVQQALASVKESSQGTGALVCPYCDQGALSERELWSHSQYYHGCEPILEASCDVCSTIVGNWRSHFHQKHGPVGHRLLPPSAGGGTFPIYPFALVVVHRKSDNKYLLVQEGMDVGYWLPGGRADPKMDLRKFAVREVKDETGMDVRLTGILRIEHTPCKDCVRMRVIFVAEPLNEEQKVKTVPNFHSMGSVWIQPERLQGVDLRGPEPSDWINYINDGGQVHPLSLLAKENEAPPPPNACTAPSPSTSACTAPSSKSQAPDETAAITIDESDKSVEYCSSEDELPSPMGLMAEVGIRGTIDAMDRAHIDQRGDRTSKDDGSSSSSAEESVSAEATSDVQLSDVGCRDATRQPVFPSRVVFGGKKVGSFPRVPSPTEHLESDSA